MLRALIFATLLALPRGDADQALSVLHIKVAVVDAGQKLVPVPRHALLISDNPATAAPRRVITAPDGTANVRLPPGNYTVESDQPIAFEGKAVPVDADRGHRRGPGRHARIDGQQRGGGGARHVRRGAQHRGWKMTPPHS